MHNGQLFSFFNWLGSILFRSNCRFIIFHFFFTVRSVTELLMKNILCTLTDHCPNVVRHFSVVRKIHIFFAAALPHVLLPWLLFEFSLTLFRLFLFLWFFFAFFVYLAYFPFLFRQDSKCDRKLLHLQNILEILVVIDQRVEIVLRLADFGNQLQRAILSLLKRGAFLFESNDGLEVVLPHGLDGVDVINGFSLVVRLANVLHHFNVFIVVVFQDAFYILNQSQIIVFIITRLFLWNILLLLILLLNCKETLCFLFRCSIPI